MGDSVSHNWPETAFWEITPVALAQFNLTGKRTFRRSAPPTPDLNGEL